MLKIGDKFTDGGFNYEVIGMHELGYPISKRIDGKVEVKVEPKTEEVKETPQYTKTQINRLPYEKLVELVEELGLAVGTGVEMKKAIIEKLEL